MEPIELAKNRAHHLLEQLNVALQAGDIDEDGWYREVAAIITPAYLAADNPRSQSGHSGDDEHWTQARGLIVDAIDKDGTFLDVGCASGYLMECVQKWAGEQGSKIEPFGLDIAPELAALARHRLPKWADRIVVGNAIDWQPQERFDFVRTGLEYVPDRRQKDLIDHLLHDVVAPGGRLIIGTYNEEVMQTQDHPFLETKLKTWGYSVAGRSERRHYHDERLMYRVLWLENRE